MATRQNYIFPRISVNKTCLIPCGRNRFHIVHTNRGNIFQVVGSKRKILYRILKQDGSSQLESICCPADITSIVGTIQAFIEETASEFHTTDTIPDKRMQTGIESLFITEVLVENQVLGSQYRLTSHIIGIHSFPPPGQGATVKNNHQSTIIRIAQNSFVQPHSLLLIPSEKVYFNSLHSQTFEPPHFPLTDNRIVHTIHRTLNNIVPISAGTIP